MERFLTPDGCSDPSYYARPALERTQIAFGSMESVGERRRRAQANMEMVIQRKGEEEGSRRMICNSFCVERPGASLFPSSNVA